MQAKRIVGFSGHMTDGPDRASPRFPESRVPSVRARIRQVLAAQPQPVHAISSGARGGDLVFQSENLTLGGSGTVLLPFPASAFKRTSVGLGWDAEFDRLLAERSITVPAPLLPELPADQAGQNQAYERCNVQIVEMLWALSQRIDDPEPLLLAVFHDEGSRSAGGTWDAIERWRARGQRVVVIDPLAD